MMFLFLFLVFAGATAALWFHGLWSNAITLINVIMSGLIAVNFFEPLATQLDAVQPGLTYLFDFVCLWAIFAVAFLVLRAITDALSKDWIAFPLPVEMTGRSILAAWSGWILMCFAAFTLQTAPLNSATPLGAWQTPNEGTFLGMNPERLWAGFAHSRSRGALARGKFSDAPSHPNDGDQVEAFDSQGDFIYKYHSRRARLAAEEGLQVAR